MVVQRLGSRACLSPHLMWKRNPNTNPNPNCLSLAPLDVEQKRRLEIPTSVTHPLRQSGLLLAGGMVHHAPDPPQPT